MAAAYAALVSLSHILQQILHSPCIHHFIFPRESVKSLRNKVFSLIKFLECFPSRRIEEIKDVETRIIEAAHEAEDIIEGDVVTQFQKQHAKRHAPKNYHHGHGSLEAYLSRVMITFTIIEKDLRKMKGEEDVRRPPEENSMTSSSSKDIMVGFDEHLDQIRRVLTSNDSSLVITPIVGMGGMGKTTLTKHVCREPLIIDRFVIIAWVKVSQDSKERDVVRALLQQINSAVVDQGKELSSDEQGVLLHKELFGRRYLIVLDDVWDIEAWDKVRRYLPGNTNGSRILVTTRLLNLAQLLGRGSSPHQMTLLDEEKSWDLIHEYVKGDCPIELEEIGRSIARGCGGLPLALVAIGGLLAQSEKTRGFWKDVETNVTSIANYADGDKKCIEILRMSYSELPVYLKPCFLYLAVFPKHSEIHVSRLIRLWVAEGFIKPRKDKILEKVAREYLKDLLDRNLVMASKLGHDGEVIKKCSIHDLMRDLCTNEAEKSKFLCFDHIDGINSAYMMINERRLCTRTGGKALRPGKHTRSLLSNSGLESRGRFTSMLNLIRVLDVVYPYSIGELSWLTNSRYIACTIPRELHVPCFEFVSLIWNLQTLVLSEPITLPPEFWQMSQLRHLIIPEITLTDPGKHNPVVLENLQTITTVRDFTLSQNVVKRIKNVIKLGIDCMASERSAGSFSFSNVVYLDKLESLTLKCRGSWKNMGFPKSLRKLTLSYCQIPWEDMSVVGSLPNLVALKLRKRAARGRKWSPNEGEFIKLKFLLIDWWSPNDWEADDTHFPSLERLQLIGVKMEEFPQDFAEIATLRAIDLNYCCEALLLSAKMMLENREDDDIIVRAFPPLEASRSRKINLVGLEDSVEELKGYLLAESDKLDVISIIGKNGIGKTTLAREVFGDPQIQFEFPTRIWFTASQEFTVRNMFLHIIKEFGSYYSYSNKMELAEFVSSVLMNKKFLLVVDDIRTLDGWDTVRDAFPKTGKVLITSRDMYVCRNVGLDRNPYEVCALSPEQTWLLLCLEVFGKPEFPSNLEAQGKRIAHQCGGLPLAVLLVGGIILKKLEESTNAEDALEEALDYVSGSICGAESGYDSFEKVMRLSYETLPHHLRKCFLYVGMFPDDYELPAWKLICLWIAEGFVQQEDDNISMEETAEKYLDHLLSSKLLKADRLKANGNVKTIGMSEFLRRLCLGKAEEEGGTFFKHIEMPYSNDKVYKEHKSQRLCVRSNVRDFLDRKHHCPSVRSFFCFTWELLFKFNIAGFEELRVVDVKPMIRISDPYEYDMYKLLHLRYLSLYFTLEYVPAAFSKFRNVQTLIIETTSRTLDVRVDIMNMNELRHFKTNASATLPNPTAAREGGGKIQTLGMISPKSCTEQVFGRARNLKKLGILGELALFRKDGNVSFHSLGKLEDLEELKLINGEDMPPLLTLAPAEKFPIKLRSLTLCRTGIHWRYMSVLASLENLEVLKLKDYAFEGDSWVATDGGFPHLQFLYIRLSLLDEWVASHDHFPRLKHLVLEECKYLQQLPLGLANIPTFQNLDLRRCSLEAASSAKKISEAKIKQGHTFSLNVLG